MEGTNIYFIGNVEKREVKIGRSNNPQKRLAELQTANSQNLVLYGVIDNVTPELENSLHKILSSIRLKGEWFKLTDKLIQFMVSRTDEVSSDYKIINNSKTKCDPLDEAIDKLVKKGKRMSEQYLIKVIGKYLEFIGESSNFDVKKLRRKLNQKEIYRIKEGGKWMYHDYHVDEKIMYPDHYICPASILDTRIRVKWYNLWESICMADSVKWLNIKFTPGYSYIIPYNEESITVTTMTTEIWETETRVIIYKTALYNASNVITDKFVY